MALDWGDVPFFLAAARTLSLSKAADLLRVSQPTMTRRIAGIERDLGRILFDRSPGGLELTVVGERLVEQAVRIEAAMQNFEVNARSGADPGERLVRIGCTDPEWLMPLLVRLPTENADISVEVRSKYDVADLHRGDIDIIIRRERLTTSGLRGRKVGALGYKLHAAASFIERRGMPTLESLPDFNIVVSDSYFGEGDTTGWRCMVDRHPRVALRTDRLSMYLHSVTSGLGIALLVDGAAERHAELIHVLPEITVPQKEIYVYCHDDTATRPSIRRTLDCLAHLFNRGGLKRLSEDRESSTTLLAVGAGGHPTIVAVG